MKCTSEKNFKQDSNLKEKGHTSKGKLSANVVHRLENSEPEPG